MSLFGTQKTRPGTVEARALSPWRAGPSTDLRSLPRRPPNPFRGLALGLADEVAALTGLRAGGVGKHAFSVSGSIQRPPRWRFAAVIELFKKSTAKQTGAGPADRGRPSRVAPGISPRLADRSCRGTPQELNAGLLTFRPLPARGRQACPPKSRRAVSGLANRRGTSPSANRLCRAGDRRRSLFRGSTSRSERGALLCANVRVFPISPKFVQPLRKNGADPPAERHSRN